MTIPTLKPLAEEYLRANPGVANRTAARQLAALYPEAFTIETARSMVRSVRGVNGRNSQRTTPIADLRLEWAKMRAQLPEATAYDFTPVRPTVRQGRYLLLSDVHVPFHSPVAVEAAIRKGQEDQVDAVILNGDIWDAMEYSSFVRSPARRDLTSEAFAARQFIAYLRDAFPAAEIIYKIGNHEERLAHYFSRNMLGTLTLLEKTGRTPNSIASVGGLLELSDYNIHMIESRRPILLGKYLYILHGHEGGGSYCPVNPARTVRLKTGVCTMAGHWHKPSFDPGRNMDGRTVAVWSIGCLCDLTPEYLPLNFWEWGFARVDIDKDGGFSVANYRISKSGELWS